MQAPAEAPPPPQRTLQSSAPHGSCTNDGRIFAEVSEEISARVKARIRLLQKEARIRDVSRLVLPCGFHLDPRNGWNLILTNGKEFRRYRENNAFGFMPAYGFGDAKAQSDQLGYELIQESDIRRDSCGEVIKKAPVRLQLCSSFGSATSFFGTVSEGTKTDLSHYAIEGSLVKQDFKVAEIDGRVGSIFFLPPPDAPGGTITLILRDKKSVYRAFVDVPRG
jgi:hypothetical protein